MNILEHFKLFIIDSFESGIMGLTIPEIFIIIASFFLSLFVRGIFAKLVIQKFKRIVQKTGNKIDDNLFNVLIPPLRLLPIVFVFVFISFYIEIDTQLAFYFEKFNRTLTTIFVFWFIHQSLVPLSNFFQKLEEILSKALVIWLTHSLKYFIIFLGIVAILEIWGIKIGPVIAGLGLFGVAVALGAQDLFKNLISGILVLVEKRFKIGDWILVDGIIEGIVEKIGFRSTTIRKFDKSLAIIPNFQFAENAVVNVSETSNWLISWIITLQYDTTIEQLKTIRNEIEDHIKSSEDFNTSIGVAVRVDKFSDSSIDMYVRCFTKSDSWNEWLSVKEKLAIEIKKIVENNKASFAFPSQSIYIEKK